MAVKSKTRAAVITVDHRGELSYSMYDVQAVSDEGAVLVGPLLLELGEVVTVELAFAGGQCLRVEAHVSGIREGIEPGMEVRFATQTDAIQKVLHGRND